MKSNSFFYCLGQGLVGIKRNKVFFIASVATITVCLFLVGLFTAIVMNMNSMVHQAQETVCVTVFFNDGLSEEEIIEIGEGVAKWDAVDHVEYTSAEEAWEAYKLEYFKDYPELAEGFASDNPLANSASYDVYLKDVNTQDEVVLKLEGTGGVRQVNRSEAAAGALSDIGKIVAVLSIVLIVILLAVSIFLISNTIVTGITMRKDEIQIMKYVGATDFFVKSPFVFEGVIIGIIGALVPLVILVFIYRGALHTFIEQFQTISSAFSLVPMGQVFTVLIPLSLILGAGIGFTGSMIATGKHIKV